MDQQLAGLQVTGKCQHTGEVQGLLQLQPSVTLNEDLPFLVARPQSATSRLEFVDAWQGNPMSKALLLASSAFLPVLRNFPRDGPRKQASAHRMPATT